MRKILISEYLISQNTLWAFQLWVVINISTECSLRCHEVTNLQMKDFIKVKAIFLTQVRDLSIVNESGIASAVPFILSGKTEKGKGKPSATLLINSYEKSYLLNPLHALQVWVYLIDLKTPADEFELDEPHENGGYLFVSRDWLTRNRV